MTRICARNRASMAGWLVGRAVVPWIAGKRFKWPLPEQIDRARAKGPAQPPSSICARHAVRDIDLGGVRVFELDSSNARSLHVLFLHGGSYVFNLMPLHWTVAARTAQAVKASVVLPLYPLAPEHGVEEGLACAERVYARLAARVGPERLVVMGDSAGGGVALSLVHRLRDTGSALPAALVLLFPWLDVTLSDPDQFDIERRDTVLSIDILHEAGRSWAGPFGTHDRRVSPLFADNAGLPPTLVLVGTHDMLLPDARRLTDRSANVELVEYPGMFHGFVAAPLPEARDAFDRIGTFVGRHCGAVSS